LIGEAEHFWQKRYYDFNVRNEPQFSEKLRYIHQNPVKRGLCARAEDWEWSSFRQYATGCAGRVEIECEWATGSEKERQGDSAQPQSPTQAKKRLERATRQDVRKSSARCSDEISTSYPREKRQASLPKH
jgi:hypothetical protein